MQRRIRHSKFKNAGILFELLTKQITSDILSGTDTSIAKDLLYKYFNENTELGREWQLYNALLTEKMRDAVHADQFLNIILESRKKLNENRLNLLKYELIKEIKTYYPLLEMLKTPIKNYKLLASICKTFQHVSSQNLEKINIHEIFQSKTSIIEHITNKYSNNKPKDDILTYYMTQNEDIRFLTYKLLIEKFNQKYSDRLDSNQKAILREYINTISNSNKLNVFIKTKIKEIIDELCAVKNKIIGSHVTQIKLTEVLNQLQKITFDKTIKDNQVMIVMLSYELLKEIKKNFQ